MWKCTPDGGTFSGEPISPENPGIEKEPPPVPNIDSSAASSSPTYSSLKALVRGQVRACLHWALEEEVEDVLWRVKHARRGGETTGYRSGYTRRQQRDLSALRPVYLWVDSIGVKAGLESTQAALLVLIPARPTETNSVLAITSDHHESAEILRELTSRGLRAPACVIADSALGLWRAAAGGAKRERTAPSGATNGATSSMPSHACP